MNDWSFSKPEVFRFIFDIRNNLDLKMKSSQKKNRRWNKQMVIEEIRRLSIRSAKHNQISNPALYGAANRHFGSWRAAVEAAGFGYRKMAQRQSPGFWTRDRILKEIQSMSMKHSSIARRAQPRLYSASLRVFGSWGAAVTVAGYDYSKIRKGWEPACNRGLKFKKRD